MIHEKLIFEICIIIVILGNMENEDNGFTLEYRIDLHKQILKEREKQLDSDDNTVYSRDLIQKYIIEEKLIISKLQQKLQMK